MLDKLILQEAARENFLASRGDVAVSTKCDESLRYYSTTPLVTRDKVGFH